MAKSPEIFDPYLGKMYGNILDQYDNPTYNLKLYLKPGSEASGTTASSTTAQPDSGSTARQTTGTTATSISTTTTNPTDKKIVVLAQTGVTGTQIDNLEIDGYADVSSSNADVSSLRGSFNIIQPGAANFLDQIQWGRKYLGATDKELASVDFFMYLDIAFFGYSSDPNDNEEGGEIIQIVDTVTYKIKATKITVKIDNTGSRYEFQFTNAGTVGYADNVFKLSQQITLEAGTIKEAFEDLEKKYNDQLKQLATQYETADKVKFNTNALLKSSGSAPGTVGAATDLYIKDGTLPNPKNSENVESTTRVNFPPPPETEKEQRQGAATASKSGRAQVPVVPKIKIPLNADDSLYKIIFTILGMNKEFQRLTSRKTDLDNPGNNDVKPDKTFVVWYDIHCEVKNIKWDNKRGAYAKEYIYTPYLVKDIRSDVALTTKEFEHLKETDSLQGSSEKRPLTALATKRLQDLYGAGALSKSYFYIFTGLNDQIINLDISYDQGIALLMPPKGGMIGDFSVTSGPSLNNSAPINKDLTLGDQLEAAKKSANLDSLVNVFKQIRGLATNINGLASSLGRSVQEIQNAITDTTGNTARALASSLDGATLNSTLKTFGASEGGDPFAVPGPSTQITVENKGSYAPEVSGFLYSDDFIVPGGSITAEQIESAGLMALDAKGAAVVVPHAQPISKSLPSPLSGMTSDGPASMMMGYAYRSRNASSFLLTIDLTLRGDPYWLTRINTEGYKPEKSSRDTTHNPPANGTKYYFLLTIGSPSKFDFNLQDEDNNSGYWSDGRVSGTFSGLYWPQKWKNRFNNGIFTTEIKANKEISVPLQWIKRVPPGQTPPDWDSLGVRQQTVTDFLASSASTTVNPGSPSVITSNPTDPNPTGFRNPLGDASYRVTAGLGDNRNHGGVDLAGMPAGTPVYATKGGKIIISGEVNGYGQAVYIDHGDGTQTRYGHLQEGSRAFTAGQTVTGGQVIGRVGNTGKSTGVHLHYEVRTGTSSSASNDATVPVDATKYLGR